MDVNGDSHGFSCQCGEDDSCLHSPTPVVCNADALPQTDEWRFDSGLVTDITLMPVKTMVYQYLLDEHEAKMAFGALQFYGTKIFPKGSCAELR